MGFGVGELFNLLDLQDPRRVGSDVQDVDRLVDHFHPEIVLRFVGGVDYDLSGSFDDGMDVCLEAGGKIDKACYTVNPLLFVLFRLVERSGVHEVTEVPMHVCREDADVPLPESAVPFADEFELRGVGIVEGRHLSKNRYLILLTAILNPNNTIQN